MISKKIKYIFALSIPFFIAHGIEEIFTGFYEMDAWDAYLFQPFAQLSLHGVMFVTFQLMFWLLLLVSLVLLLGERWRFYLLGVIGVVYIFELHHIVKAVLAGGYYPGLITSLAFPVIAYFFWKEWGRLRTITKDL
ncbi:HXXEE domain-containing protein [bacterium]|nr:HXXEE domain-containing protein [bacterium]